MSTIAPTSSSFPVEHSRLPTVHELHGNNSSIELVIPPALTPPSQLISSDLRLLALSESTHNTGELVLSMLNERLRLVRSELQSASTAMIQKLRGSAEKAKVSEAWGILNKIATTLLSALSMILGTALVSSGASVWVGGAMITSGILSLANLVFNELGAWEFVSQQLAQDNAESQKKLAKVLPMAVGILSAGVGLAGAGWGVGTQGIRFFEEIVYLAQAALTIFNSTTAFGKGVADARLIWAQASLSSSQAVQTKEQQLFTSLIQEIKGLLGEFQRLHSKTSKAIQKASQIKTFALRI